MAPNRRYPSPDRLNRGEIDEEAEAFLEEFWPQRDAPVNIEHIADVEAELNIVPEEGLFRAFGVDSYLSSDLADIFIDASLERPVFRTRYRYALAREVAHWYLHEPLYRDAQYEGVEAYRQFQRELPASESSAYDWQASVFADYILAPPDLFTAALRGAVEYARSQGFSDLNLSREAHRAAVAEWIGRRLEISSDVVLRRGEHDDRLWSL